MEHPKIGCYFQVRKCPYLGCSWVFQTCQVRVDFKLFLRSPSSWPMTQASFTPLLYCELASPLGPTKLQHYREIAQQTLCQIRCQTECQIKCQGENMCQIERQRNCQINSLPDRMSDRMSEHTLK